MAAKKRKCKRGRTKAGTCRKKRARKAGSKSKRCRTVRVKGHTRKMCKRGKRWLFAKG